MSRAFGVVIVLWMCAGAAKSNDVVQLYRTAMDACARSHISVYDDGVTSAILIARVLVGVCRRENQVFYTAVVSGRSDAYRDGFNRANVEEFTGLVLLHRTGSLK